MGSGSSMREVIRTDAPGKTAAAKPARQSMSAQLSLFEEIDVTGQPRRKIPKRRAPKYISPDDEEFWRGWETETDEQSAMIETLEQMWKAGVYEGYGKPPDEWYRKQRLRHCPYRNAVQLDFLDALREPTVLLPVLRRRSE